MMTTIRLLVVIAVLFAGFCCPAAAAEEQVTVPVLCYHRFGPTVADGMTVTTKVFESQLQWLKDHQYTVIPLRTLVNYLRGQGPPPPPKSVVITADDAHKTVYSDMLPLVRQYNIPVTLFVYPSCVSNASYAMTWEQLKAVQATGLFDMQSHTFWHPNFKKEKQKLTPEAYQKLVDTQMQKSRAILEKRFETRVDILAWPFGIYDDSLQKDAERAGYVAAFSIDRRHVTTSEPTMALPRYLIVNGDGTKGFESIITGRSAGKGPASY
jgi:peptidoglycan/xylan/chitin deacetylase (PgdA/CDA1 family)